MGKLQTFSIHCRPLLQHFFTMFASSSKKPVRKQLPDLIALGCENVVSISVVEIKADSSANDLRGSESSGSL